MERPTRDVFVPGVYSFSARRLDYFDDFVNGQVTLIGRGGADAVGLVGHAHVLGAVVIRKTPAHAQIDNRYAQTQTGMSLGARQRKKESQTRSNKQSERRKTYSASASE